MRCLIWNLLVAFVLPLVKLQPRFHFIILLALECRVLVPLSLLFVFVFVLVSLLFAAYAFVVVIFFSFFCIALSFVDVGVGIATFSLCSFASSFQTLNLAHRQRHRLAQWCKVHKNAFS